VSDKNKLKEKRGKIEELGLSAIEEFFDIDTSQIDKDTIKFLHNKARLAMQFEKEININKRSVELNYLRVFKLVSSDKSEIRKLIQKTIPQYLG
jgi:hypothetical protein